jgi:hypothetical protein
MPDGIFRPTTSPKPDTRRANVRFTIAEHARIRDEALASGLSIPTLLKNSHFKKRKLRLLLSEPERRIWFAEIRRIGVNVNQIAKRVNSGLFENWHPEFLEVAKTLAELKQILGGVYGVR